MHELFLFAQLPHTRREQLRSILTGIAAHHPIPASELYTVAKPARSTAAPSLDRDASLAARNALGGNAAPAQREALHMHVVRKVTREDFGTAEPLQGTGFRVRFPDIPEPGAREIGLRRVDEFPVEYPDAEKFIRLYGYTPKAQYVQEAERWVHGNVVLLLFRLLPMPSTTSWNGPIPATLKPLCPANSYVLSAVVRLSDGTNPKLVAEGTRELEALRETMKGVVKFENPDRLSMDTRFK